jgi:hypothetical protein
VTTSYRLANRASHSDRSAALDNNAGTFPVLVRKGHVYSTAVNFTST